MKCAIFAQNSQSNYSGGRYHSWIMAEGLAHAGHDVFYITDNKPIFSDDFINYPNHNKIRLYLTKHFTLNLPSGFFDVVVLVPSMNLNPIFYYHVLQFSFTRHAHLILLNFETPNWFNSLSPSKRSHIKWLNWKFCAYFSSLILSSSKESEKYARKYFKISSKTKFASCYPAKLVSNVIE